MAVLSNFLVTTLEIEIDFEILFSNLRNEHISNGNLAIKHMDMEGIFKFVHNNCSLHFCVTTEVVTSFEV